MKHIFLPAMPRAPANTEVGNTALRRCSARRPTHSPAGARGPAHRVGFETISKGALRRDSNIKKNIDLRVLELLARLRHVPLRSRRWATRHSTTVVRGGLPPAQRGLSE